MKPRKPRELVLTRPVATPLDQLIADGGYASISPSSAVFAVKQSVFGNLEAACDFAKLAEGWLLVCDKPLLGRFGMGFFDEAMATPLFCVLRIRHHSCDSQQPPARANSAAFL